MALTIFNSSSNTETVAACESYFEWIVVHSKYVYSFISINTNGCDSITTLDLTIYNATTSTENVVACDEYFGMVNFTFRAGFIRLMVLTLLVVTL